MNVATASLSEGRQSNGATVVLPGQSPDGGHILSVLLKRTYQIVPGGLCVRAEADRPLLSGDQSWGNPLNSTVRFESDFIPYKLATDVVVEARAYAPRGVTATSWPVGIKVADRSKIIRVIGDRVARFVDRGVPSFTDPVPVQTMELRYERAYGGVDVYSDKANSYPYPRNPLGCGFVVANAKDGVDNLPLPNIEDPDDLLTPERLCLRDYAKWVDQPMPAGLGWFPKTSLPRAQLAGVMPADRAIEQELRQAYARLVPENMRNAYLTNGLPDMDFRFFNGASPGLIMPYLKGDERIEAANLAPGGTITFFLPGEMPGIGLDVGSGMKEAVTVIHTVMIRMEEREVDIVWRGAVPYPGRDWLPQMRKMVVLIE